MPLDTIFSILGPALFVAFGSYFIYRMVRHGGLRGAMFGAKVERTVGEVPGESAGPVHTTVKVHSLEREPKQVLVGLELVTKSFASYQTVPATLSPQEALKLASLLQVAARGQTAE